MKNIFNRHKVEQRELNTNDGVSAISCSLTELMQQQDSPSTVSSFYGATELISNSIATLPIRVKRGNKVDTTHPLNLLFNSALVNKFNLVKQLITDVINHGNAYLYIERANDGTPIQLIYCEHGSVNTYYNQRKQELYYNISFCRRGRIEPIDVIHLYKNAKSNGVEGRSIVSYANTSLDLSKATNKSASKYYSSGCALQGALTIKGSRKNSKEQARQAFVDTHSNGGSGLVILDDDMSYTPISSNANDSQMIEARTFNVAEIARYFTINPILLGDNSGANFSSIEAANIEYCTHTLMAYVSMLEAEFNRKLVKPSEQGNISIDIDETILMRGDMNTTANYLRTLVASGIMSINEARAYLGFDAVEGGDTHNIAYSKVEDNKIEGNDKNNEQE